MRTCAVAIASISVCSVGAFAGSPYNDLLYGQAPGSGGGVQSSATDYGFLAERHAEAVPFPGLPLPARVYRIDWWGGSVLSSAGALDNIESFNIRAYDMFNNSVLFDEDISAGSLVVEATGMTVGPQNSTMYSYSLRSDTTLFFGATVGMISIAANYTNTPGAGQPYFLWAGSFEGDAEMFRDGFDGQGFTPTPGNLAFALYGAIPAPGAAALLCVGGVMGSRRRR